MLSNAFPRGDLAAMPPNRREGKLGDHRGPGAAVCSLRRADLTPGYMLSLLRSWPMVVTKRNVHAHRAVKSRKNDVQHFNLSWTLGLADLRAALIMGIG